MTDTPAGVTEGVPEWDPFSSNDPQIKFLIAAIVTSAVVLTENPQDMGPMRTLLMAAGEFKKCVTGRLDREHEE